MKDPFYISAIWRNKRLTWYWDGKYWFCWKSEFCEEGFGDTYDEAFEDWQQQVEGN